MAFVVFAGQSNTVGFGMTPGLLPAASQTIHWGTYVWNHEAGGFEVMIPGVNTGTPGCPEAWGPEVAYAEAFRRDHPDEPLFIVKSAKGSTGLGRNDDRLDWSAASEGELFDLTAAKIAAARAAAGGVPVDEVLLFQGEQDAYDHAAAAAYADNLRDWLAAIRAEWVGDPDGRIVMGLINDDAPTYAEVVRQAQSLVDAEDPNTVSIETRDLAMQADQIHYAAESYMAIGQGFYDAWI